jgi:hypothetical protein
MATTEISVRSHNLSIVAEPDTKAAINGSNTFESLFYNLALLKYRGYDAQGRTIVGHKEATAIVINCLIHLGLWSGRVVGIEGSGEKLIDEDMDSRVKIPDMLLRDDVFVKFFALWNDTLKNSEWPYSSIPNSYGLRDRVVGLIGLQTQEELDILNPKREIEYAPGAVAKITYD